MGSLASLFSVSEVGLLARSRLSIASVASLIGASFDAQDLFGFLNIIPVFERDLNLAVSDLVVSEQAFLVPLLDLGKVLAFVILGGCDIAGLVVLCALHGDIACDRVVPVAFLVAKLEGRVGARAAADEIILGVHLGSIPKFVGLDLLVLGREINS